MKEILKSTKALMFFHLWWAAVLPTLRTTALDFTMFYNFHELIKIVIHKLWVFFVKFVLQISSANRLRVRFFSLDRKIPGRGFSAKYKIGKISFSLRKLDFLTQCWKMKIFRWHSSWWTWPPIKSTFLSKQKIINYWSLIRSECWIFIISYYIQCWQRLQGVL